MAPLNILIASEQSIWVSEGRKEKFAQLNHTHAFIAFLSRIFYRQKFSTFALKTVTKK